MVNTQDSLLFHMSVSLFLLLLPSCFSRRVRNKKDIVLQGSSCDTQIKSGEEQSSPDFSFIREQEARLMDIPLPLDGEALPAYFLENKDSFPTTSLAYQSSVPRADLLVFYKEEMERFGWKKKSESDLLEVFLYFEKPERFCAISLRPSPTKDEDTIIVILFGALS